MAKITYIDVGGTERVIEAKLGQSVMETAVKNGVPGIVGECGGNCACGTCRVYVDAAWQAKTGEPAKMERDMLTFTGEFASSARLSCQIKVADELDGLIVRTPESQY